MTEPSQVFLLLTAEMQKLEKNIRQNRWKEKLL